MIGLKTRYMTKYSPAETGEYPRIFPNFQNCACCKKDLKDNTIASIWGKNMLGYYFVVGVHYLFLKAHSFPQATLLKNCSLIRTDNVCRQILEHIFMPNGGYCLFSLFNQMLVLIIFLCVYGLQTQPKKNTANIHPHP